ncbi:MAG: (Fe-S)-binding protein, partial [Euryarchaeota archaeon]|nr:(Fe-S)-binding protein [Euryarchaeota archaeon]
AFPPLPAHGDIFRIVSSLTSQRHVRPRTVGWLRPGLRTDESSNVLLFVGCTPYFDVHFKSLREDMLEIPRAAVRLLNALDIEPRVIGTERCCGHDVYWLGDEEAFASQARANLDEIGMKGVDEVIAFCPECYSTLHSIYPLYFGPLGFKVRSLTAVIGEAVTNGMIQLDPDGGRYTYQDPCRLARHSGIVSEPREVLATIGELAEMPRSGAAAACCGTSCWTNCGSSTKEWQAGRLREARETGASALVTACPKCLVHLTCAQREKVLPDPSLSIPLLDIHVLASSRLTGK